MGLSNGNMALVLMAMRNARARDAVATIGKQVFWPSRSFLERALAASGSTLTVEEVFAAVGSRRDGSEFFKLLGAAHVDEVDASDYEGASIVHDMNIPLPPQHRHRYDVVFDGGSLEHIFDVRQVLENIGSMLKVGGLFVGTTPANNLLGHGFYQFSPELFYRYFSPANGWGFTAVFLCEHQRDPPGFWFVEDPQIRGRRIEIQTRSQLNVLVVAERTANIPSPVTPQQSDYVLAWNGQQGPSASPASPLRNLWTLTKRQLRRLGLHRLRPFLPTARRTGFPGLDQPGIRPLTTEAFLGYSLQSQPSAGPS